MKQRFAFGFSNRLLVAFVVCADLVVFGGGFSLERFALKVAADPTSSSLLIIALLVANLFLLGVIVAAMSAVGVLLARAVTWLRHRYARVEFGEIFRSAQELDSIRESTFTQASSHVTMTNTPNHKI